MANTLGERIKELRKEKGLTQLELANKLNLTDKAVSKWEANDGNPDIMILSKLSEVLDVTIDYLLTGKIEEEKMNLDDMNVLKRAEYIIKKDDVENFAKYNYNKLNYLLYDNIVDGYINGNCNIRENIYKFQSIKIFSLMVDLLLENKNNFSSQLRNALSPATLVKDCLDDFIKMCALANRVDALEFISFPIFAVGDVSKQNKNINYSNKNPRTTYLIKEETLDFIYTDERVGKEVLSYISKMNFYSFENKYDTRNIGINFFMNDIIISKLYKYKKIELLDRALKDLYSNLDYSLEKCTNKDYDDRTTYRKIEINGDYSFCSKNTSYYSTKLVAIIFPINLAVREALNNNDVEWVIKFNDYNKKLCSECYKDTYQLKVPKYYLTNDEIELVKLKADPKSSKDDILIQKYTENGITDLDKMINDMHYNGVEVDNFKKWLKQIEHIEKDLIDKFYINELELVQDLINKKDYSKLFKWAVNCDYKDFIDLIIIQDNESIINLAIKKFVGFKIDSDNYLDYFKTNKKGKILKLKYDIEGAIEKLTHANKLKNTYENCCTEINEEYINTLIKNDDLETAVIKLCVRLEATLKHICKLDGDLIDMIDEYVSRFQYKDINQLYWEAEQNEDYVDRNVESEYIAYNDKLDRITENLHELRKVRNSIVHSSDKISYTGEDVKRWANIIMKEIF